MQANTSCSPLQAIAKHLRTIFIIVLGIIERIIKVFIYFLVTITLKDILFVTDLYKNAVKLLQNNSMLQKLNYVLGKQANTFTIYD